jgi:hypothetical protein|tara:strand:- start:2416 stop:3324 length:909 start_codon:yes stop_codon:yes gene_type:complete
MKFLIAGATGLIGKRLSKVIIERNNEVNILTTNRNIKQSIKGINIFYWNPELDFIDEGCVKGVDVVINLAGSPIAQLWTRKAKKSILQSRVNSIELLYKAVSNDKSSKVRQFICASAIGLYKSDSKIIHNENSKEFSKSFLGDTVCKWEDACDVFKNSTIKLVKIRIGLVLSLKGGFLKPIVMLTKLFLGTWFGKGRNIYSWIHIFDVVGAILFLVDKNSNGVYNLVAPRPVNSKNFMIEISKKLNRRIILPSIPLKLIKVLTGKMLELIIFSQNVSCEKIIKEGFEYEFKDLNSALENLLK